MRNGAIGGKLVGAGSGGFLLFYAKQTDRLRPDVPARGPDGSTFPIRPRRAGRRLSGTDMQCLVLAGGQRSKDASCYRLRPQVSSARRRPTLRRLATRMASRRAGRKGRLQHRLPWRQVRRHVGNGRRLGLEIEYVDEGDRPRGTAGALRLAVDQGVLDSTFFVLYGDSYLRVRLRSVEAEYCETTLPVLMTVYRDPGGLERSKRRIRREMVTRYEKGLADPPPEMRHRRLWPFHVAAHVIEEWCPPGRWRTLGPPFDLLSRSGQLAGYEAQERFYEIGSPDGLRDLEEIS